MFRPGDTVTFSASPVIKLAEYQYLKPQATITRTLEGDNPAAVQEELAGLKEDLRQALLQSLLVELEFDNEVASVLNDCETLEEIAAWAMKEAGYGGPQEEVGKEKGGKKGPGKGPGKKK